MTNAAPGWYADPKDPTDVRWFDGNYWTEHQSSSVAVEEPPAPAPARSRRTLLLVVGGVTAGLVVLGLLVAAAVPVFHRQQERVRLEPINALTCDDVASEAIALSRTEKELGPLDRVTNTSMVHDNRGLVDIPAPGAEEFVMSCAGMGSRPDGTSGPLTIQLYIDHDRSHLLWYSWDT